MKRILGLTIVIGLMVVLLTGCSKNENILEGLSNSKFITNLSKTDDEILQEKLETLVENEINSFHSSFDNKFILIAADEKVSIPYSEESLNKIKLLTINQEKDIQSGTYKKKSNQELLDEYVFIADTNIKELTNTLNIYNDKFKESISKIKNELSQRDIFYIEKQYNNAEIDEIIDKQIITKFFNKYQLHKKYVEIISNSLSFVKETKELINNYVYNNELKEYLSRLNKKNYTKLIGINNKTDGELAYKALYENFTPQKNILYDLGGFKVFQSIKGGLLLIPNASYQYKSKHMIFVETNKEFVDNQLIEYGKYKVIKTGIKKYTTVLGVSKSVYSFRIIADVSKNKYHFDF